MLVHISVRNSAGDVHVDKVVNDAEARRVMDKAIEKGAEFSCRHHKAPAPPRIEAKQHDEAVKAAAAIAETDREDIYAAGYAAMVDKLAEALGLEIGTDDVACLKAIAELDAAAKALADRVADGVNAGALTTESTTPAPSKATPAKQSKK